MIGATLAHYRIVERLGSGGMGEVYRAEDLRLHRQVAIKVLPPAMATEPERLERFAREAKAIGALNHPNIVTIHAIEEVEGQRLLVMELVDGPSLDDLIPAGGMDRQRFFDLAIQLADAVSAAHEHGVTHRDLKPSNVMVAGEDRVKVVDFGLAKLRQEARSAERTVAVREDLTEEGRILGTYPYMSPEQIKGLAVDHRSDLFSLGVVLYEMATGERPFLGETSADLISSILRDEPPPPAEANRELPRHLDRIIAHCLEKDPDRRFQTAKDLRNELQSLRTELQSESLLRSTSWHRRLPTLTRGRGRGLRWAVAAAVVAAVAVLSVGAFLLGGRKEGAVSPPAEVSTPAGPSVAVLYFQNLTGDPELEWLRTGLTEMLVTDLSQSPGLRVTSTDRLYEILQEVDALNATRISAEAVRRIAERAGVGAVLLGSYAQAGETLLVNVTLKDPASGAILDAERVQGAGESSIFSIVDSLGMEILQAFERMGHIDAPDRPDATRRIENVTTSSVEAYRLYAEGVRLSQHLKFEEAIPLLEEALELDPGFAMAAARLARIYESLGREEQVAAALEKAAAHRDRLPPRERFFIEGQYQSRKREGFGTAIETLEEGLRVYPDHQLARYQAGLLLTFLEAYDRAIAHFEILLREGYDFDGLYTSLGHAYLASGRPDEARRLLEDWANANSERWSPNVILAWHAVNWRDVELARDALEQAESLRPGSPFNDNVAMRLGILTGRWQDADAAADELIATGHPYWLWRGSVGKALIAIYRGDVEAALAFFEQANASHPRTAPLVSTSRNLSASLLLASGEPRRALAMATQARSDAAGAWPGWEGTFWAALADERLGRSEEADRLANELADLPERLPGPVEDRLYHRLLGLLARERGDAQGARVELQRAVDLLPPHGEPWHRHRFPDNVPLWYELATVDRELGDTGEAERLFRRVVDSGTEHIENPVEYVRSHYFLGRLLEERGDRDGARKAYEEFLSFWSDGDLDRDRVEDARGRLAGLGG